MRLSGNEAVKDSPNMSRRKISPEYSPFVTAPRNIFFFLRAGPHGRSF